METSPVSARGVHAGEPWPFAVDFFSLLWIASSDNGHASNGHAECVFEAIDPCIMDMTTRNDIPLHRQASRVTCLNAKTGTCSGVYSTGFLHDLVDMPHPGPYTMIGVDSGGQHHAPSGWIAALDFFVACPDLAGKRRRPTHHANRVVLARLGVGLDWTRVPKGQRESAAVWQG